MESQTQPNSIARRSEVTRTNHAEGAEIQETGTQVSSKIQGSWRETLILNKRYSKLNLKNYPRCMKSIIISMLTYASIV